MTDQPIGEVSPVGRQGDFRFFIDNSLAGFNQIWSACGTPNAVFATTYDELKDLTNASPFTLRTGS